MKGDAIACCLGELLIAVVAACHITPPVPTPQPDADAAPALEASTTYQPGGSTACLDACITMARWCGEGLATTCPEAMTKIEAEHIILAGDGQPMSCMKCMKASTPAEVLQFCASSCTP